MTVIVHLAVLLFFVVSVGKICGRLLGVHLGVLRGSVVGALGWVAGLICAGLTLRERTDSGSPLVADNVADWLVTVVLVIFFGVLVAMPLAIGLDLLTRTGHPRPRRSGVPHPIRAVKAAVTPYSRLREVVGHARRADLLHLRYVSRDALEVPEVATKLREVVERSGGMLVKFGQIASTRSDILPEPLVVELAKLRAEALPIDAEAVRAVLEAELDAPVAETFRSFDWQPLAAASIGQTHRAVLRDGTRVVVKVQRPGIDEVVRRDATVLRLIVRQLERRVPSVRSLGLKDLSEELISGIEEELDYLHEASVGMRLRELCTSDEGVAVPGVFRSISTARVLVMEEVVGGSIADRQLVDGAPVPRHEIAGRLLSSFLRQVLADGVFHADPHPGNIMLDAEGTIWLLDFGSVGVLDTNALDGLRSLALGVATKDPAVLARAARDMAGDRGMTDLRALEADMSLQLAHFDAAGVDPSMIGQVLQAMQRHGLRPPASITLLARALLTLDGTLRGLDPGFDFGRESESLLRSDKDRIAGSPKDILQRELLHSLPALKSLPEHAETLANQLRAGRLTVRTARFDGPDGVVVGTWVDRAVLAVIGGFTALTSAVLLFAAGSADNQTIRVVLLILGFVGLVGAAVILMRGAARALRRELGRNE